MIACSVSSLAAGIVEEPIRQGRHLTSNVYPLTAFIYRLPSYVSPVFLHPALGQGFMQSAMERSVAPSPTGPRAPYRRSSCNCETVYELKTKSKVTPILPLTLCWIQVPNSFCS